MNRKILSFSVDLRYVALHFIFLTFVFSLWLNYRGLFLGLINMIEHWKIVCTMVIGSFIAGSTALGGGAVSFPVMTKVLGLPADISSLFSLGIQSFGMMSATLFILVRRIRFYPQFVMLGLLGSIPGVLFGTIFLRYLIPGMFVKLIFTSALIVFAFFLHFVKSGNGRHLLPLQSPSLVPLTLASGFLGGIISGIIGSGADIAIFLLMVLVFRCDIRAATSSSVMVMGITSAIGTTFNFYFGELKINQLAIDMIHAAMPIVIIGAPIGAYICSKMKESAVYTLVISLIFLEAISTFLNVSSYYFSS